MDANEQKARELLAAEYAKAYAEPFGAPIDSHAIAVRVIAKAIAQQVPADGEWVLVPRDPTPEMIEAGIMFGNSPNKACIIYQSMLAATPQAPQPVVDAPFDPASDKPTKPGKYSEPGAEHVHKRGEAECPTCGTACRTEYVLWSSQFLGTQSRTDYIPASQPQQGAVACGFRYRVAPNEECRSRPWTGAGIVAEWNQPTPPDNETIQYQTLYATIGQQAVDDACNCPGGSKPASMHAPNCPVRTTENK